MAENNLSHFDRLALTAELDSIYSDQNDKRLYELLSNFHPCRPDEIKDSCRRTIATYVMETLDMAMSLPMPDGVDVEDIILAAMTQTLIAGYYAGMEMKTPLLLPSKEPR